MLDILHNNVHFHLYSTEVIFLKSEIFKKFIYLGCYAVEVVELQFVIGKKNEINYRRKN